MNNPKTPEEMANQAWDEMCATDGSGHKYQTIIAKSLRLYGEQVRRETIEECAMLHQDNNGASDTERYKGLPGCDVFGAIIEYRDKIPTLGEKKL